MNKQINHIGAFCETYGNTIPNRILEYIMENEHLDFAAGDMAKELKISKPKSYQTIKEFEKKGYIKKSRIIGKTQLYTLNKENIKVKLFLRNFKECLRIVTEEYSSELPYPNINVCSVKYQFSGRKALICLKKWIGRETVTIMPVGTDCARIAANTKINKLVISKK